MKTEKYGIENRIINADTILRNMEENDRKVIKKSRFIKIDI